MHVFSTGAAKCRYPAYLSQISSVLFSVMYQSHTLKLEDEHLIGRTHGRPNSSSGGEGMEYVAPSIYV